MPEAQEARGPVAVQGGGARRRRKRFAGPRSNESGPNSPPSERVFRGARRSPSTRGPATVPAPCAPGPSSPRSAGNDDDDEGSPAPADSKELNALFDGLVAKKGGRVLTRRRRRRIGGGSLRRNSSQTRSPRRPDNGGIASAGTIRVPVVGISLGRCRRGRSARLFYPD